MSVQAAHTLKQLETRRHKMLADQALLRFAMTEAQQAFHQAGERLKALDAEIARLTHRAQEPVVSEHALLRYLERVYSLNLEELRQEILTPGVVHQIQKLKSGRIPLGDGTTLVVEDKVVRTVETAALKPKILKKKGRTGPKPAERRSLDQAD